MHRELDPTKLPAAVLQADREDAAYRACHVTAAEKHAVAASLAVSCDRAHQSDLRRHLDAEEAAANRAARGEIAAMADFMGRIARGEDFPMPAADYSKASYRVSEILGEPFEDARQILFAACREAVLGKDCGALLRKYVEAIKADYAASHAERYE